MEQKCLQEEAIGNHKEALFMCQADMKENQMLHYSVVFLVIALIAAVFGFGGIAAGAVEIAKILFFLFAIMAIVSFVISLIKKN